MQIVDNVNKSDLSESLCRIYDLENGPRRILVRKQSSKPAPLPHIPFEGSTHRCKRCRSYFKRRPHFKKYCSIACRTASGLVVRKKHKTKLWPVPAVPLHVRTNGVEFYRSREWLELRYRVLAKFGRVCMCCGVDAKPPHVDHIKPKSKHPELALRFDNLQVLCHDCNMGKSNLDETDWRPKPGSPTYTDPGIF